MIPGEPTCAWCGGEATQRLTVAEFSRVTVTLWCDQHVRLAVRGRQSRKAAGYGGAWRVTRL